MPEKNKPADRAAFLAAKSREELESAYRHYRESLNESQLVEIIGLFVSGHGSKEIAKTTSIPISTVRCIISYACSIKLDLYLWHTDAKSGEFHAKHSPPVTPSYLLRYVPKI